MSRPTWQRFESVLADPITRYLALKRSMGCRFGTEDRALRLLDRYVADQDIARIGDISSTLLEAFLASRPRPDPTSYNNLIGVVRRLFEWMVEQQELAVSPLAAPTRPQTARRLPFLYQPETIRLSCSRTPPSSRTTRGAGSADRPTRRSSHSSPGSGFGSARPRGSPAAMSI